MVPIEGGGSRDGAVGGGTAPTTEDSLDELTRVPLQAILLADSFAEVFAIFERAEVENQKEDNVILEVNSLRLSCNLTEADCAGALFCSIIKRALTLGHSSPSELVKNAASLLTKWQKLLKYYLPSIDEEIEVILKVDEMCLESTKEYSPLFVQILHLLYDKDIIQKDAILNWASEKEGADESDKLFLKQAEKLIQWLNEASEEEDLGNVRL